MRPSGRGQNARRLLAAELSQYLGNQQPRKNVSSDAFTPDDGPRGTLKRKRSGNNLSSLPSESSVVPQHAEVDSGEDTGADEYDDEEVEEKMKLSDVDDREREMKDKDGHHELGYHRGAVAEIGEEYTAAATSSSHGRNQRLQLIEANSPAVFVRELGLKIDASVAPQLRHYSWNLRYVADEEIEYVEPCHLTEILSFEHMRQLADVFFVEVHPVYNFVDRQTVDQVTMTRWSPDRDNTRPDSHSDSFLAGIAALGCLFSKQEGDRLESQLVHIARRALEHSYNLTKPTIEHVMGWLLRTIYLRLAGSLQATWMATMSLMHLIETTKLHLEPSRHRFSSSVLMSSMLAQQADHDQPSDPSHIPAERRRRIFWVAQIFNTWVSIDCGRSPVELRGGLSLMPRESWTIDQRQLWHSSRFLNPDRTRSQSELVTEFERLCSVKPSHPMLLFIQCNIALCICRRMRALRLAVCGDDRFWPVFLSVARESLAAARNLSLHRSPWCHVLNVPFQLSCTFLALDKRESLAPLREALDTLKLVVERYDSKSAQDSYRVACCLVVMKHRQRLEELNVLDGVLLNHSSSNNNNSSTNTDASNPNPVLEAGIRDMITPSLPFSQGPPVSATTAQQPIELAAGGGVPYTEWSLDFMNGILSDPYFTLDYQFPFAMA